MNIAKKSIALGTFLFSQTMTASTPVKDCPARAHLFFESARHSSLPSEQWPRALLVARKASLWVEGHTKGTVIRLQALQSFTKAESRILCASTTQGTSAQFSLDAPTLIDLTLDKKAGNSFWKFQTMVTGSDVGVWNQKSEVTSTSVDFTTWLEEQKGNATLYQVSHDQLTLVIKKRIGAMTQVLEVLYDVLEDSPF